MLCGVNGEGVAHGALPVVFLCSPVADRSGTSGTEDETGACSLAEWSRNIVAPDPVALPSELTIGSKGKECFVESAIPVGIRRSVLVR